MCWTISAAFSLPARRLTFLSQQAECDCREKKSDEEGEVERGSVYRKRERERGCVLKWSSSQGSSCIVISVPVQSALSSQCKTYSVLRGTLLETQRQSEDWILHRKL